MVAALQVGECRSGMDRVSKLALKRNTRRAAPGPVSEMTGTSPRRVSGLIPYDTPVRSR